MPDLSCGIALLVALATIFKLGHAGAVRSVRCGDYAPILEWAETTELRHLRSGVFNNSSRPGFGHFVPDESTAPTHHPASGIPRQDKECGRVNNQDRTFGPPTGCGSADHEPVNAKTGPEALFPHARRVLGSKLIPTAFATAWQCTTDVDKPETYVLPGDLPEPYQQRLCGGNCVQRSTTVVDLPGFFDFASCTCIDGGKQHEAVHLTSTLIDSTLHAGPPPTSLGVEPATVSSDGESGSELSTSMSGNAGYGDRPNFQDSRGLDEETCHKSATTTYSEPNLSFVALLAVALASTVHALICTGNGASVSVRLRHGPLVIFASLMLGLGAIQPSSALTPKNNFGTQSNSRN